jgi:3-oxoacyl-[acyl-carrier-protein] synthase II
MLCLRDDNIREGQAQVIRQRRVVVTGLGALTPLGNTAEQFWHGLIEGRSGVGRITQVDPSGYPTQIAGEVLGFDPADYMEAKEARRASRVTQFAVATARQAVRDAGLDEQPTDAENYGVLLGVGNTSFPDVEQQLKVMVERGGRYVSPLFMPMTLPNMTAGTVALQLGWRGYISTVAAACASGNLAIGEAAAVIARGDADVIVTGGYEAAICEFGLASFCAMRAMRTRNEQPTTACRPFDATRDGFVPAEGAASLVLEELGHALARDAHIYAEVAGFGVSSDAYHPVSPRPDGSGMALAMGRALRNAGFAPSEIEYINAHGTSTQLNDAAETLAIKQVFGDYAYNVPISATKSMIGHALSAGAALEAVASILTMRDGVIHPTINYHHPDPACDLDYVPNRSRQATVRTVLSNSFAFGGQNICIVLQRI